MRRAEGTYLHPRRDAKGVHHFSTHEVEALRAALVRGTVRLSAVDFERKVSTASPRKAVEAREIALLRLKLAEAHAIARGTVELLFALCPERVLHTLDDDLLAVLHAALAEP